jgi:3-oxoacyl-[acyl-carrier-protein] synthase III
MDLPSPQRIGMAAIGRCSHDSLYALPNKWFEDRGLIGKRFTHYTGIQRRWISTVDEVDLASQAIDDVLQKTAFPRDRIVALVFISNSFVPVEYADLMLDDARAQTNRIDVAAQKVADRARLTWLQPSRILSAHWGCSGFPRAMMLIQEDLLQRMQLGEEDAIIVVAATRTSRITDYEDRVSSPLLGDYATATLITRLDSRLLPARYELIAAMTGVQQVPQINFGHEWRRNVLVPTSQGGETRDSERFCFWLDGDVIYKYAPQIMADTACQALEKFGIRPTEPDFLIPHQAGAGIGRWFDRFRTEKGIAGEFINGYCAESGNITSCSIPYTFAENWDSLRGLIVCPTAGVGNPGESSMSCGCVAFRHIGN